MVFEWFIDNIGGAIIGFIVSGILGWVCYNWKFLKIKINTMIHRNEDYRISYAYLFRIKIRNKYLLIKGNRIDQYQPIGGVYKYFDSFSNIKNKMQIIDEKDESFYESNDLRIFLKGKNVIKLLKWIETSRNRECNYLREFYEELIEPGYLEFEILKDLKFEFIKRVNSGVHYSPHFKCKEILIFDVIEVSDIDSKIEKSLKVVIEENNKLVLVSADDIDRECFMKNNLSTKIGAHCKLLK